MRPLERHPLAYRRGAGSRVLPRSLLHVCPNCEAHWCESELAAAPDLLQRVDPGGTIPSGECPDCGFLCYAEEARDHEWVESSVSRCGDCRQEWLEADLDDIIDLDQRVEPGERMPSGQCPGCGALCQLL